MGDGPGALESVASQELRVLWVEGLRDHKGRERAHAYSVRRVGAAMRVLGRLPRQRQGAPSPTSWHARNLPDQRARALGPDRIGIVRDALARQADASDAQSRRTAELQRLLVLTIDPSTTTIVEFVELARDVLGGDRHTVWSQPGSLGSDFDDFADQDFHSELQNRGLIDLLFRRIDARLVLASAEQDGLRNLFRHPSETIQVAAYERIAKHVGPVVAAQLGRELLEAHALHTRTEVGGDIAGLALAGLGSGAGENHVDTRKASRRLLNAVRAQLSPLAAAEVRSWLASSVAAVRRLAVTWLGEVGVPEDDALFHRVLGDGDGQVVLAALIALTRANPGREWSTLLKGAYMGWSAEQLGAAVNWWFRRDHAYDPVDPFGSAHVPWRRSKELEPGSESAQVAVGRLLVEAARRVDTGPLGDEKKQAVARATDQLLRRVEELEGCLISAASWPAEALADWLTDASPWMRRVWVRAMARRDMREASDLLRAMFDSDDPADRRVGLVELSALGASDLLGRLDERWRRITVPFWSSPGKEVPEEERPDAWEMFDVLIRGPVEFAWLLPHVSRIVEIDEEANMISSEGVKTLQRLASSIRRWGVPGFEALLHATGEAGRGGECAEYLLVHLRDELPTEIRERIAGAGRRESSHQGEFAHDGLAEIHRQITQPTPEEEDTTTEARIKERIGSGEAVGTGNGVDQRLVT